MISKYTINQIISNQAISLREWEWYRVKEKENESQIRKETDWESKRKRERKKERKKEIRRELVRKWRYQKKEK